MKEADAYFKHRNQSYLQILIGAMLLAGYYGLLRAGEITKSPHCLLAKKCTHWGEQKEATIHTGNI